MKGRQIAVYNGDLREEVCGLLAEGEQPAHLFSHSRTAKRFVNERNIHCIK